MYQVLEQSPLFNGLNIDQISEKLAAIHTQVRHFSAEQLIIQSSEELRGIYIVIEGTVRGEMNSYDGKVIKIEDIGPSRVIAPAFIFGENNCSPVHILANSSSELLYIQKREFLALLQNDPQILMNYLNIISSRAQFLTEKIKFLNFKSIKEKFVHYILSISKKTDSDCFRVDLSQEKLADLFGVTRPALARIIKQLNDDLIIATKGKEVTILNREALIKIHQAN